MDQRGSIIIETLSRKRRSLVKAGLSTLCTAAVFSACQAGVLLQGFYWDVPSPAAGNSSAPWWWDHIGSQANALASVGFSAIWIPPVLKGASGGYSDGYDPFDDYDIGSKNQESSIPTRYGTRQELEKCCAMFRANGIDIYCDIVDNHRDGDPGNFQFNYIDAYGNANLGRFGKSYYDFHPNVPQDPDVPDGSSENFNAFGRDLAPINGPSDWIYDGLESSADWLTKALDLEGYRLDDVPGISTDWLNPFLSYNSLSGKFAVGEYYDSNVSDVKYWEQTMMNGRCSAFDYPLRDGYLKQMCNSPSSFNMASLFGAGLIGTDPTHSVTFVENHDTDRSEPITQNKMLAYAFILTNEGYPCVFYKDYSSDTGCYGLSAPIQNLMWIHEKIASGNTTQRFSNNLVYVYERTGGSHLLVGLNNNTGYDYKLTCATGLGANVHLHDYTGHCPDIYTDASGNATLDLPVATNGNGYCCYSVSGITGSFTPASYSTKQEYAGASDLDIKPADNTATVSVCQVWVAANTTITSALYYTTTSWTSSTYIYEEIDNPSGTSIGTKDYYLSTAQGATFTAHAASTGWYTFKVRSYNTPSGNAKPPYWLDATYTSSKT